MSEEIKIHLMKCVSTLYEQFGSRLIFVGLYGSQNYNLETENSDYDFKAIVVPSLDDIIFSRKPVSTIIFLSNGLCDVKSITLMMNCWKKQNVNFVELLFTKYKWVNPEYKEILQPLFDHNEEIVHYDEQRAINCIKGMQMEKYHALFKLYPSQMEVINKYGYAAKQLCHIWRLKDLISKYVDGEPYFNCLTPSELLRKTLIDVKEYKPVLNKKQVEESAKVAMDETIKLLEKYSFAPINEEIGQMMDNVTASVIRKALKSELEEI